MKHRKPSRAARRAAALGVTAAAAMAFATGTAAAGPDDQRCERADGVVVCLPADVDLSDLDVDLNILTHEADGYPDGYWDLGP